MLKKDYSKLVELLGEDVDTRILKSEAVKVLEAEIKRLSKKNKI